MTQAQPYDDTSPEQGSTTARVVKPDASITTQRVDVLTTGALPSLSPAVAKASRSLFSAPRLLTTTHEEASATWTVASHSEASSENQTEAAFWVKIETSQHSFWLSLFAGSNRMPLGDRVWHQYEGENRLLAWALSHESFLQHLSLLLNDVCTPAKLTDTAPQLPNKEDTLLCQWQFSAGSSDLIGHFYWTPEHWEVYGVTPGWQSSAPTSKPHWRERLPVPCRLWLQGHCHSRDDIRQFDPGDCLLVTGTFRTGLSLHLQPRHSQHFWKADIQTGKLIVKQGPETMETTGMPDTQQTEGGTSGLEVELTFELGGVTLPLATVEQLQGGYVMELPEELDQARVQVRANGTRIGTGRLVTVGDHLGVQLIDLNNNGV